MVREKVSNPTTPVYRPAHPEAVRRRNSPVRLSRYRRPDGITSALRGGPTNCTEQRGQQEGGDLEDWVKAEQQLAGEAGK